VQALRVEGHGEADAGCNADLVAKDGFEMVTANNERPVETLFPDGPYPALRDRVRPRRSHRRLDYLYAFGGEHLVEAAVNFASRSRIKNRNDRACSVRSLRGCGNLGDKEAGRMIVTPTM